MNEGKEKVEEGRRRSSNSGGRRRVGVVVLDLGRALVLAVVRAVLLGRVVDALEARNDVAQLSAVRRCGRRQRRCKTCMQREKPPKTPNGDMSRTQHQSHASVST